MDITELAWRSSAWAAAVGLGLVVVLLLLRKMGKWARDLDHRVAKRNRGGTPRIPAAPVRERAGKPCPRCPGELYRETAPSGSRSLTCPSCGYSRGLGGRPSRRG